MRRRPERATDVPLRRRISGMQFREPPPRKGARSGESASSRARSGASRAPCVDFRACGPYRSGMDERAERSRDAPSIVLTARAVEEVKKVRAKEGRPDSHRAARLGGRGWMLRVQLSAELRRAAAGGRRSPRVRRRPGPGRPDQRPVPRRGPRSTSSRACTAAGSSSRTRRPATPAGAARRSRPRPADRGVTGRARRRATSTSPSTSTGRSSTRGPTSSAAVNHVLASSGCRRRRPRRCTGTSATGRGCSSSVPSDRRTRSRSRRRSATFLRVLRRRICSMRTRPYPGIAEALAALGGRGRRAVRAHEQAGGDEPRHPRRARARGALRRRRRRRLAAGPEAGSRGRSNACAARPARRASACSSSATRAIDVRTARAGRGGRLRRRPGASRPTRSAPRAPEPLVAHPARAASRWSSGRASGGRQSSVVAQQPGRVLGRHRG